MPALATHAPIGTILFDGVCNLCNGFVQWVITRDPKAKFQFGALQSAAAQDLVAGRDVRPMGLGTVLYVKNGRVLERSTAVLTILKDLGGPWSLLYGFIILPPFLRDGVYRWVARNRYKWFGQRESCMLPTPELRGRFIDQ
ncbi:MAG TPA: thiol-disulfide oxidoreductase DCC family protein [Flavobacteriales bacterium]|nr:thiol-disulfide oxidoreductase DCC family protein [Flavobacteriales bacterium]HNU58154.1 thiol-disulfide oxidoreductase DCC family protein [Flavobacteriales bacterium]